ncbi:MAG: response regulator [Magnetococcales bacterium]|nr:response regulator [Magnetococcales bacterium]
MNPPNKKHLSRFRRSEWRDKADGSSVPYRESISQQLFWLIFSIYLLISLLITSIQILETFARAKKDITHEMHLLARSFDEGIVKALWEVDEKMLQATLDGMLETPTLLGVKICAPLNKKTLASAGVILDETGNALWLNSVSMSPERFKDNDYLNTLFRHESDLFYHQETDEKLLLGHMTLYSGRSVILNRISFSVLVIILSEIFEILAIWLILLWVGRRLLGRPLATLIHATTRLAQDDLADFRVDIQTKGKNELKLLEEAFNQTAAKLHNARDELENRMRLALTAGHIATWVWYPENDQLEFDDNLPSIFGQHPEKFGRSFLSLQCFIIQPDRERVVELLNGAIASRQPCQIDFRVTAQDGRTHFLALQATTQYGENELSFPRMVGTVTDITEHKRLTAELEASKNEAESASRTKSQFLATISHEIRTPMNAILGMGELLSDTDLSKIQSQYVSAFSNASRRLLELVNDILDLSKIESGQTIIEKQTFELGQMINEALALLLFNANKKSLPLIKQIDFSTPYPVIGDPNRLRQVLINLLGNAIKFTDQGQVELLVRKEPFQQISFTIIDTGCGISAAKQQEVFKPFVQADPSTTRKYGGTGLGLSISKQLVELMGGELTVQSNLGQGSRFTVVLPLPESRMIPENAALNYSCRVSDQTANLAPSLMNNPSDLSGWEVLLCEDVEENILLIRAYLKPSKCRLSVVFNGAEAVAHVKQHPVDLILMDLHMPIMDGFTATRIIRDWQRQNQQKPTPIIALSALSLTEILPRIKKAGCDHFLAKPFGRAELYWLLNSIQSPLSPSAAIQAIPMEHSPLPSIDEPPLNTKFLEKLRQSVGLEVETALSKLFKNLPQYIDNLEAFVQSDDFDQAGNAAHKIKGATSSLGAVRLAGLCQQIEISSTSEPSRVKTTLLAELKREERRVLDQIKTILAE